MVQSTQLLHMNDSELEVLGFLFSFQVQVSYFLFDNIQLYKSCILMTEKKRAWPLHA